MKNDKTSNKPIYKQWWFWVAIVAVLAIMGFATQGASNTDDASDNGDTNNSQNVGALPKINEADYKGEEGLVAFKDLAGKGYSVTAKYENAAVPATNRDLTETFTDADATSCSDRLGWDAYIVSDLKQDGDAITLILGNEPTDSQNCPAGTTNDL